MTGQDAFFQAHRDLPRQGPGTPEDVAWAITQSGLVGNVRILDAGCGPGADLETFAALLPQARLDGVDMAAHLVAEAQARVPRADVRVADMAAVQGSYDLIWCAGAMYFLGVGAGLRAWRDALAPGGAIAFSEPVLLDTGRDAALQFWEGYAPLSDLAGIRDRVSAAGYETLSHRLILGAPWDAYYTPLQARIAALRPTADVALDAVLDQAQREIDLWRQAPDAVAYALLLVRPV